MNHVAKAAGAIRHILTTIGGALLAAGVVPKEAADAADYFGGGQTVAGAILVIAGFGWSVYSRAKLRNSGDPRPLPPVRGPLILALLFLPLAGVLGACAAPKLAQGHHERLGATGLQLIEAYNRAGYDPVRLDREHVLLMSATCLAARQMAELYAYEGLAGALGAYCPLVMKAAGSRAPMPPTEPSAPDGPPLAPHPSG